MTSDERFASASNGEALLNPVVVGGLKIGTLSRRSWAEVIAGCCLLGRSQPHSTTPAFFTSANGNVLSLYARSPEFRRIVDTADGVDADGMPLVMASRMFTDNPIAERCSTTDFVHDMAEAAIQRDLSFFLLGGTEKSCKGAAETLERLHSGLRISGYRHGYFSIGEEREIVDQINAVGPDLLWVGLGVPKEQEFVHRNRERLKNVGAIKTCGGLFDFLSGKSRRAPEWMRNYGLEWLHRLMQEPGRLWKRYLFTNIHALYLIARHTSGR